MTEEIKKTSNVYYWSRAPGKFVNKHTGQATVFSGPKEKLIKEFVLEDRTPETTVRVYEKIESPKTLSPGPTFCGTVREWYETLAETIIEAIKKVEETTGFYCSIHCEQDVLTILECTTRYKLNYSQDLGLKKGKIPEYKVSVGLFADRELFDNPKVPKGTIKVYSSNGNTKAEYEIRILDMY